MSEYQYRDDDNDDDGGVEHISGSGYANVVKSVRVIDPAAWDAIRHNRELAAPALKNALSTVFAICRENKLQAGAIIPAATINMRAEERAKERAIKVNFKEPRTPWRYVSYGSACGTVYWYVTGNGVRGSRVLTDDTRRIIQKTQERHALVSRFIELVT